MKYVKSALILSALTASAWIGINPAMATGSNLNPAKIPQEQVQEMTLAFLQQGKARSAVAPQTPAPQTQIQMPPPEAMIIMVRASLVALSQANVTNNYTVLNQLGSSEFQQSNSPARLSELFASFRSNNIDLAPVVFVTPQLSQQPRIEEGKLRMIGFFPTQPMQVNFDLQFEPSEGIWKLFGIAVNLIPVQQAVAQAPQPRFVPGQGRQPSGR